MPVNNDGTVGPPVVYRNDYLENLDLNDPQGGALSNVSYYAYSHPFFVESPDYSSTTINKIVIMVDSDKPLPIIGRRLCGQFGVLERRYIVLGGQRSI